MKIAPLRMNADYESMLFYHKQAPQILNHSLESFIFFLETRPLVTSKKYSQEFLDYVESYKNHPNYDGYLYIIYSNENTFG